MNSSVVPVQTLQMDQTHKAREEWLWAQAAEPGPSSVLFPCKKITSRTQPHSSRHSPLPAVQHEHCSALGSSEQNLGLWPPLTALYTCRAPSSVLQGAELCHSIPEYWQCHLAAARASLILCSYKWIRDLSGCQVNHHYHSQYHLAHTPHGSQLLAL